MEWVVVTIVVVVAVLAVWGRVANRANANQPAGRALKAAAEALGYNSGSEEDRETFEQIFELMVMEVPIPLYNQRIPPRTASRLAQETVGSRYPMAANAAWAVVSFATSEDLKELTGGARPGEYVGTASTFQGVFPGIDKTPVLGKPVITKVANMAVAAALILTISSGLAARETGDPWS